MPLGLEIVRGATFFEQLVQFIHQNIASENDGIIIAK
jgi:hypothetical protein